MKLPILIDNITIIGKEFQKITESRQYDQDKIKVILNDNDWKDDEPLEYLYKIGHKYNKNDICYKPTFYLKYPNLTLLVNTNISIN